MALIKCSECSNEVSDKAESCPKCGAPISVAGKIISDAGLDGKTEGNNINIWMFLASVVFPFIVPLIYQFTKASKRKKLQSWVCSVGFVAFIIIIGNQGSKTTQSTQHVQENPKKTPEQIAAEEEACKKDLHCYGEDSVVGAGVYCAEYVEKLAKYSHEWTDGMLELKFSHYRWKDIDKGVITHVGDKIKFQNGFGAWENYIYECDYDPINKTVLDVRAKPGKL